MMLRHTFTLVAAALVAMVMAAPSGDASTDARSTTFAAFDLFGPEPHISRALVIGDTGGRYLWPGNTLSASVQFFPFDQMTNVEVAEATWVLAWTPTNDANGVRLVHALPGPQDLTVVAEQTGRDTATPIHSRIDVTDTMQALVEAGEWVQVGHQIRSTGSGFPVYSSRVEVLWRTTS